MVSSVDGRVGAAAVGSSAVAPPRRERRGWRAGGPTSKRWGDRSAALAKADAGKPVAPAARAHDDGIAIFEEAARLARCERQRAPSARRDLEQAAEPLVGRRRDRAGAEQIARAQIAAAAAVMRNELRHRPVEMARVAERQSLRGKALRRKS